MSDAVISEGTRVEMGQPGTPSYRVGRVRGMGSSDLLGRGKDEPSELVTWESGEEEWVQRSLLRVVQ
ncbi:MAG: hypothetical protein K0R38_2173 [Polyangiaceae bacterium]|jgi:hypothetical protein|nr:hypothetical protein [Polyangiaceae bacterium]